MNSIETTEVLFQILNADQNLRNELSGGIYTLLRPDDSGKEDITINNLFLNRDTPQTGTSNVNIHVPDMDAKIGGKQQKRPDEERLKLLTKLVTDALEKAVIPGLQIRLTTETVIKEPNISEHYNNIRIDWNIQL